MNSCLPEDWIESTFGGLNQFASQTVDPSEHSDEEFELYSVPSFPTDNPERLPGGAIGSTKQSVAPGDVLVCKINPRINRVWQVKPATNLKQIASSEWIGFRASEMEPRFFLYYFRSPHFRGLIRSDVTGVGGSLTRAQPKNVATFAVPVAPAKEQSRIADQLDAMLARVNACNDRFDGIPAILKRFRQCVLTAATLGELTKDWRGDPDMRQWLSVTVGQLLNGKPRNGYSPQAVEHETPVRSLTLSATTSGKFLARHSKFIDEHFSRDSHLWLEPGDILIQRANSLDYVGVSAIFDGPKNQFIYPDLMMKCRANDRVLTPFLFYVLSAEATRKYFRDNATGTAGNMPKINQQTVIAVPAQLPPLDEQIEIVRRVESLFAIADRLEARCTAARAQVARLTPLLLAKAFRGELVPQDPADEPASELLARLCQRRADNSAGSSKRRGAKPGHASVARTASSA